LDTLWCSRAGVRALDDPAAVDVQAGNDALDALEVHPPRVRQVCAAYGMDSTYASSVAILRRIFRLEGILAGQ
jgi:hypothetical protein